MSNINIVQFSLLRLNLYFINIRTNEQLIGRRYAEAKPGKACVVP